MEDNEVSADSTSRGNERKVVSLASSEYAAAPGSTMLEMIDFAEAELSKTMFMSVHFVSQQSQHENFPLESDDIDIPKEYQGEAVFTVDEGDRSHKKGQENWGNKSLSTPGVSTGQDFPENKLSLHITDYESTTNEMNTDIPEIMELSNPSLDFPAEAPKSSKHTKYISGGTDLHCEAWNRRASSLMNYAKETNALWSIFKAKFMSGLSILALGNNDIDTLKEHKGEDVFSDLNMEKEAPKSSSNDVSSEACAWWNRRGISLFGYEKDANELWPIVIRGAVMGLLIFGHRWSQEKGETTDKLMGPLSQLKDELQNDV